MISQIPPITKHNKNLFPAAIKRGAIEIFGEQSMQAVLLRLVPAPVPTEFPQPEPDFRHLLHLNEVSTLSGYRFPKRRSEYLTGRICAKMAVQRFFDLSQTHPTAPLLHEIEIASTENGRPIACLQRPQAEELKLDISISHSGEYGVALATASKCGIDVQLQNLTLLRVQEKYCSKAEDHLLEASLTNHENLTRLTMLWAAKEAAKKALSHWQMPGFHELEVWQAQRCTNCIVISLHVTTTQTDKVRKMPEQVKVVTGIFNDYVLAICLVDDFLPETTAKR